MDIYKAREYLNSLSDVYADINRNMAVMDELRSEMGSTGGAICGDRVKCSARGDRIESVVAKLIDYEEKTNRLIAKYDVMRKCRVKKIDYACNKREADVLKAFYIYRKSNREISDMLNISESTVHRLHKNGLKQFAQRYCDTK